MNDGTFERDAAEPCAHIHRAVDDLFHATGAEPYEDALNIVQRTLHAAIPLTTSPGEQEELQLVLDAVDKAQGQPVEFRGINTAPEDPDHVKQVINHIAHLEMDQVDAIREQLIAWREAEEVRP